VAGRRPPGAPSRWPLEEPRQPQGLLAGAGRAHWAVYGCAAEPDVSLGGTPKRAAQDPSSASVVAGLAIVSEGTNSQRVSMGLIWTLI
jgi:hypothetical protein